MKPKIGLLAVGIALILALGVGFVLLLALGTVARPSATPTSTPVAARIEPTKSSSPTAMTPTSTMVVTPTSSGERLTLKSQPPLALRDWPRPIGDNGLGIHFLGDAYYSEGELDRQIARMVEMRMKWTVVVYGDEIQLEKAAKRLQAAGIMAVWRKMLRPNEAYFGWERDVSLLQRLGMAPYMQLYNEPSLPEEWDGKPADRALFLKNLLQASRDVYNAGGLVGWQFVNQDWLISAIRELKARQGEAIFNRMFFVPHSYGLNHPPDYTEDVNSVLGFLVFAEIYQKEAGKLPPMVVGEGGWKYKATDDDRFPKVDDNLHRNYHLVVFNWFRAGKLSNGQALPDYLFAFCPWILSGKLEGSAWYDSFEGDRVLTINAVKSLSPFVRKFSWDQR